jgi:aryl-alcohol dehydrogenase-like predicted oxidoreductase
MKYRKLGATGLQVSEIGFGAWGIGGRTKGQTSYGDTDDAISREAINSAFDRGITFFDTSNVYGDGHSEFLLGEVLEKHRNDVVLATKAGFVRYDRPADFSPANLRGSLEGSLRRLKTEFVDLLQLHNPPIALLRSRPEILATLKALQHEGRIRTFGLSTKSPGEAKASIEEFGIGVVQANFNMLDLRAVDCGLLDLATARGVGVIARTPLCFGFLSGGISPHQDFPIGDHRNGWPRAQIARWCEGADRLHAVISPSDSGTRIQVALRWCLSFPAITTVIPGMLTPREVNENIGASELGPLSPDVIARVVEINRSMDQFGS